MTTKSAPNNAAASKKITKLIKELAELEDWRGETLAWVRKLIHDADPEIQEDWKWGIPVWAHDGGVCTAESHKQVVKLTLYRGAAQSRLQEIDPVRGGRRLRGSGPTRSPEEITNLG